ncbi:hypothetical protein [Streptomyces noursei]
MACGDCGAAANQPTAGIARVVQRGARGWRICVTCDAERAGWDATRAPARNPLAALIETLYEPVSALAVRGYGPAPYRVLIPYSDVNGHEPTDDPGPYRWHHVPRELLEEIARRSLAARWEQAA